MRLVESEKNGSRTTVVVTVKPEVFASAWAALFNRDRAIEVAAVMTRTYTRSADR